ncbi:hypothetical protein SAMD00019534_102440 [Acytostelium subglobosum LB1]|uniref:hypothetical protein n=1 Tax=Acytostelium subglobosum LB1 TaxID=1410327 RepID=UPI00064519BE|nr:hypothetical protein SAMD00019534_102440 [Acytostelium subglobosum LB1]GAM27069.1 hypothetical protein SAMD00019534_102440 [Acytostelium subglobosum LB1]|eukprot:XP_012749949.1 hypothetical protein SAMD00019534_102440 [Acytostelium subglobosum LB1]
MNGKHTTTTTTTTPATKNTTPATTTSTTTKSSRTPQQRSDEILKNVTRLYYSVTVDNFKREQELEGLKRQQRDVQTKIDALERTTTQYKHNSDAELDALKRMIAKESARHIFMETMIKRLRDVAGPSKQQQQQGVNGQYNSQLRELLDFQSQINATQKSMAELIKTSTAKEEHLDNFIRDLESRVSELAKRREEMDRAAKNKKEVDLLIQRLEKDSSTMSLKASDIIVNIQRSYERTQAPDDLELSDLKRKHAVHNNVVQLLPGSPGSPSSRPTVVSPSRDTGSPTKDFRSILQSQKSSPNQTHRSSPNLHNVVVSSNNKTPLSSSGGISASAKDSGVKVANVGGGGASNSSENLKTSSAVGSKGSGKPQSPDITAERSTLSQSITIQTNQYPITLDIQGELHYSTYSLAQDMIGSLRQRFFEQLGRAILDPLDIRTVDDLSIKTSSHIYFSDEKAYVKYIPYFADQINQTDDKSLNPVLYIVSKKHETLFNHQINQILENYNESIKTTNEESIYFRNKMISFLDSINKQRKKQDGEIKSFRGPMLNLISKLRTETQASNSLSNSGNYSKTMPNLTSQAQQQIIQMANQLSPRGAGSGQTLSSSTEISNATFNDLSGWKSCSPSNRQTSTASHAGICTIRIFISHDIIKTFQCHVQTSVGDLIDSIYSKFAKIIQMSHKVSATLPLHELKTMFVYKIRGLEIFLLNQSMPLSSIDFINTKSRRQKKIDLLLIPKSSMDAVQQQTLAAANFDYLQMNKPHSRESLEMDLDDYALDPSTPNLSHSVTKRFRLRIGGLKNFYTEKNPGLSPARSPRLYICCQMYHCGYPIGEEMQSTQLPLTSNPSWLTWVENGPSYNNIPSNTTMCLQIKAKQSGVREDVVVGWVNFRVWNYQNRLNSGFHCLSTWDTKPDPIGTLHENHTKPDAITLSFEIEMTAPPIIYAPLPSPTASLSSAMASKQQQLTNNINNSNLQLSFSEMQALTAIIEKDPLSDLTQEEQDLCWKHRFYCKHIPKSTAKVILSVPWNTPACVQELYHLLADWSAMEPVDCLELLSSKFLDTEVRRFAIRNLRRITDAELSLYLPQLVQALKHEPNHYSILARFLLRRVLLNRQQIGHVFFWQIKAEISNLNQATHSEWVERYSLILEAFLKGSTTRMGDIFKQFEFYTKIKDVAIGVKAVPATKHRDYLGTALNALKLANDFQLPINPELRARGIEASSCKVMHSKTLPLWMSFFNHDPLGDNITTIFKAGDDLRQDQLTIQMIDLMDRMWLAEGIDLQTISYKCIATGPFEGMIEVVGEAMTIAEIQKLSGGITAAFSETAIASWLKQVNPSEFEYNVAVENFVRSCAGCCVYTFILGIGDRHNDNIMITKSGHLFHIDFGRFLGNVQTWNGIKRERAPFVFPPSFAHIIGEHFKTFEDLCGKAYNIIRKKAHIFLNLFLMMVSTGMPELSHRDDIIYLRDALALDLNSEQATAKFSEMIQESLKTRATGVNFAVHILANPN